MSMKQRLKAMREAIKAIEKQFGRGSIMALGDQRVESVPTIGSGSPTLDEALHIERAVSESLDRFHARAVEGVGQFFGPSAHAHALAAAASGGLEEDGVPHASSLLERLGG